MTSGNNNGHQHGTGNGLVSINGNGHKSDAAIIDGRDPASSAGQALLWDGLSPAVTQALSQPIDPALVSQRKGRGGRVFDYLEGHAVIDQANRIFGYGGWGAELVGDVTLRRIESVNPQTGEVTVSHAYSAPVRVTVAGALPRTDVGFHAVTDETAGGHDTALKGAVTDGMKRAFRSFGPQFGNALYGDQTAADGMSRPERVPAQAPVTGKPAEVQPKGRHNAQVQTLRKRLFEIAGQQGFDGAQVRTAVQRQTGKELDELTAAEIGPLVEAAANKLRQRQEAQAA